MFAASGFALAWRHANTKPQAALFLRALRALTQSAQMFQGIKPRIVAIAPNDLVRIIADGADRHRLERLDLARLQDAKRIGGLQLRFLATRAGALLAQMCPKIFAAMAVAPFDDETILAIFLESDGTQNGSGHGMFLDAKEFIMIIERTVVKNEANGRIVEMKIRDAAITRTMG